MSNEQTNYGRGRRSVVHQPKPGGSTPNNRTGKRRNGRRKTNGVWIERG